MSPTQAFKTAFLLRCADEGLTIEQTHQRVKTALAKARVEKRAVFEGMGTLAMKGLGLAAFGLPVVAGVAGGRLLADMQKDPLTVDAAKTDEELSEIERLTDRARRLKQLRAAQHSIGG